MVLFFGGHDEEGGGVSGDFGGRRRSGLLGGFGGFHGEGEGFWLVFSWRKSGGVEGTGCIFLPSQRRKMSMTEEEGEGLRLLDGRGKGGAFFISETPFNGGLFGGLGQSCGVIGEGWSVGVGGGERAAMGNGRFL